MPKKVWGAPNLEGRVAVVTGASRGVGRGIAVVLGECGATVYVTGRSVPGHITTGQAAETIDHTAEQVSQRGGRGIAVRCDHSVAAEVEKFFARIRAAHGRVDILINNAWGGYETVLRPSWFWEAPLEQQWDKMFVSGLRTHLVTTYYAVPLMLPTRKGLIVSTVAWDHDQYIGSLYDISKHATVRFIFGLARELRQHRIAAVAVAPGFTRTERVLQACRVTEENWHTHPGLKQTESPEYAGRTIATLAADRQVMRKSGKAFRSGELAREYGIKDVDGRRVPPFRVRQSFEKIVGSFQRKS